MPSHENLKRLAQFAFGLTLTAGTALLWGGQALAAGADGSVSSQTIASPAGGDAEVRSSGKQEWVRVVSVTTTTLSTDSTEQTYNTTSGRSENRDSNTSLLSAKSASDEGASSGVSTGSGSSPGPEAPVTAYDHTSEAALSAEGSLTASGSVSSTPREPSSNDWMAAPVSFAGGNAMYQSRLLSIQPVITGYGVPAADLASAMPSAPGHNPNKAPAKSSGLLGELTAGLAGTVVPPFVWLKGSTTTGILLTTLSLITLLLGLRRFVFSYGLWLRRSGYAHAARSDMPSALTFATPRLMGYVRVLGAHST